MSRRTFLGASATAAGAAAVGTLVSRPLGAAAASGDMSESDATVVAHVRRGSRGAVTLMSGERAVQVHDPDLARRITRAAR